MGDFTEYIVVFLVIAISTFIAVLLFHYRAILEWLLIHSVVAFLFTFLIIMYTFDIIYKILKLPFYYILSKDKPKKTLKEYFTIA